MIWPRAWASQYLLPSPGSCAREQNCASGCCGTARGRVRGPWWHASPLLPRESFISRRTGIQWSMAIADTVESSFPVMDDLSGELSEGSGQTSFRVSLRLRNGFWTDSAFWGTEFSFAYSTRESAQKGELREFHQRPCRWRRLVDLHLWGFYEVVRGYFKIKPHPKPPKK